MIAGNIWQQYRYFWVCKRFRIHHRRRFRIASIWELLWDIWEAYTRLTWLLFARSVSTLDGPPQVAVRWTWCIWDGLNVHSINPAVRVGLCPSAIPTELPHPLQPINGSTRMSARGKSWSSHRLLLSAAHVLDVELSCMYYSLTLMMHEQCKAHSTKKYSWHYQHRVLTQVPCTKWLEKLVGGVQ